MAEKESNLLDKFKISEEKGRQAQPLEFEDVKKFITSLKNILNMQNSKERTFSSLFDYFFFISEAAGMG